MKAENDSSKVVVQTTPEPLEIDLKKTAVIMVDMQNAFISKGGMFDLNGIDISQFQKLIDPCARITSAARSKGVKVIHIRMAYNPDLSNIGSPDSPHWYKTSSVRIIREKPEMREKGLVDGTWGADVIAPMEPKDGDIIINKQTYNGFFGTNLDLTLKTHGIKYLIFIGGACNVCLGTTLTAAFFNGYFSTIVSDATYHSGPEYILKASLFSIEKHFGWVTDSEKLLDALSE